MPVRAGGSARRALLDDAVHATITTHTGVVEFVFKLIRRRASGKRGAKHYDREKVQESCKHVSHDIFQSSGQDCFNGADSTNSILEYNHPKID